MGLAFDEAPRGAFSMHLESDQFNLLFSAVRDRVMLACMSQYRLGHIEAYVLIGFLVRANDRLSPLNGPAQSLGFYAAALATSNRFEDDQRETAKELAEEMWAKKDVIEAEVGQTNNLGEVA